MTTNQSDDCENMAQEGRPKHKRQEESVVPINSSDTDYEELQAIEKRQQQRRMRNKYVHLSFSFDLCS